MVSHAPFLEHAFHQDVHESTYTINRIDGHVPHFVRGTYYLNGPAKFSHANVRYRHWLDGDGMICRLHFNETDITFTNRFVRSTKFTAEAEAGQALFRSFGTAFEGDQLERGMALASPVNVSVLPFNGKLLAFGEQGLPWELDPVTLATHNVYTFGGRLNPISPFSAHPKLDPCSSTLFNFGISFSAQRPMLNFYHFDTQGETIYRKRYALDLPRSMHDFSLNTDYAVFYLSPHVLDITAMMQQEKTLMESLSWVPEKGALLLIVDRHNGTEVTRIPLGQAYCLHLINSFVTTTHLYIDVIELDQPVYDQYEVLPDLFTHVRYAQPVRYCIDITRSRVVERQVLNYRMMADFPAIDPRQAMVRCDDFWLLGISHTSLPGRKFFNQLAHLNWRGAPDDIFQAPLGSYLSGEPVFIPDPNNTSTGVVLCQMFDAPNRQSAFALFDAFDIAAGPIALLHLKHPVHLGFHAVFEAATD